MFVAVEDGTIYAAFTLRLTDDAVEIRVAGGTRLWSWVRLLDDAVTAIARKEGKVARCQGRRGWSRFARMLGWKFKGHDEAGLPMFEKEV